MKIIGDKYISGHFLKTLRAKYKEISRKELSQLSGFSISTINKYEAGTKKPSLKFIKTLPSIYYMPIQFFIVFLLNIKQSKINTTNKIKELK